MTPFTSSLLICVSCPPKTVPLHGTDLHGVQSMPRKAHSGTFGSQHSRKELDPVSCNWNQNIMWEIFYWSSRYWASLSHILADSYLTSYSTHVPGTCSIRSTAIRSDNPCKAMNAGVIMGWRAQGLELLLSAAEVSAGMDGGEMPKDAVPAVLWHVRDLIPKWCQGVAKNTDFYYLKRIGAYC